MADKYIIGVDGSPESSAALRWGLQRAAAHGAKVELLYVADDSLLSDTPVFLLEAQQLADEVAQIELAKAQQLAPDISITATGVVGHALSEFQRASDRANLLVLGGHHGSALSGTFFGTRGVKIAAAAHCPVAVVPPKYEVVAPPRIVVGIDNSAAAHAALQAAAQEASATGANLQLIYAWLPPTAPGIEHLWSSELIAEQEAAAQEVITKARVILERDYPQLLVSYLMVKEPPVQALVSAGTGAQALVVGTRGHGSITRFLLGSVSHGVLQTLPCPVIVTRA